MSKLAVLGVVAFAIALAYLIGQRLSDAAMAVVVGSVIGVAASMPMSGLVLWLVLRQRVAPPPLPAYPRSEFPPRDDSPKIIVVQPQPYAAALPAGEMLGARVPFSMPAQAYGRQVREFKIVGQEAMDDEERDAVV